MSVRCPLCRAGILEPVERRVLWDQANLVVEAWHCPACREIVLDAAQIDRLRAAIRREGLAASDEQVEHVLERLRLQPG